jgi:hypothetical protein
MRVWVKGLACNIDMFVGAANLVRGSRKVDDEHI